jgi:hypothetical protein
MPPINKENLNPNLPQNEKGIDKGVFSENAKQFILDPSQRRPSPPQNIQLPPVNIQNPMPVSSQPVPDPASDIKKLISAGYTPSLDVIRDLPTLLKNKSRTDWANRWLAVLIQKLIRETN